ncbi:MAG: DUF2236 domain-containing protein [Chitinophagaceae bacterium]|nr:DUF2236 domain-containing protein [Chitinophagaceae bacterium]
MECFVSERSILREIWGKSDTILFIFAGAAAEFAVNKSVDWLYFTGKLPADPIGRLFSTVDYARQIIFSNNEQAESAIAKIRSIHSAVETARGSTIPQWAYRDVLFMLINYSITSFELLERKLTLGEKNEILVIFNKVGAGMGIEGLPEGYQEWQEMHTRQLEKNLEKSRFSVDLYKQYEKHLGAVRFRLLIELQKMLVPERVRQLLFSNSKSLFPPVVAMYKFSRLFKGDRLIKSLLLPSLFKSRIEKLDRVSH